MRTALAIVLCTLAAAGCGGDDGAGSSAAGHGRAERIVSATGGPILWGAWSDRHRTGTLAPWDMKPIDELERVAGKRMSLFPFGTPFADHSGTVPYAFPTRLFDAIHARGAMPLFSWAAQPQRAVHDPDFTLSAIAAGRQDAYVRAWATAAKAWGAPFLLRFGWEMNGDWFPWAPKFDDAPPSTFVAAWRHIHDIFRAVGATNARWVWCPTADPDHVEQPLAPLYPGDAYVDWTCLDGYNRDEPWQSAVQVLGPSYDEITQQIAPGKPMLLGEIGSTETGGDKAQWIADLFAALPDRLSQVHALAWFDQTVKAGAKQHADWPFDSTPASARAFARGIASPRYKAGGG